MTWIIPEVFTEKWIERAERNKVLIDEGDKFISLWIAFNSWMKGKFGETQRDRDLIERVKSMGDFKDVFTGLKKNDTTFAKNLRTLEKYTVEDMRYIDTPGKIKKYDGTFESLVDLVYQIRCNLFHGRKDTNENEKDFKLVCLSYDLLLPLFKRYLKLKGHN